MSMVQEHSRIGRRLSAIVAADVAGYSRLMGLDEAGTARILREHRVASDALVAKHGGRIVKTTGDGLLLEFPSVVAAVECIAAAMPSSPAVTGPLSAAVEVDRQSAEADRQDQPSGGEQWARSAAQIRAAAGRRARARAG